MNIKNTRLHRRETNDKSKTCKNAKYNNKKIMEKTRKKVR